MPRDIIPTEPKSEMASGGTAATQRPSESHDSIFGMLAAKLRVARSQQEVAGNTADHSKWSQTQFDVDEASLYLNKYMKLRQELITASEDRKKAIAKYDIWGTGTSEDCAERIAAYTNRESELQGKLDKYIEELTADYQQSELPTKMTAASSQGGAGSTGRSRKRGRE